MHIQLVILNDKVNLNGAVCTKEFIHEIADHSEQYEHLPLFCDLDALRQHRHLSHNYDPYRDEFGTSQIGSFESFTTAEIDGVLYLIGTAKVSKRNRYIIDALQDLAARDELKFSYEIETAQTIDVDGVEYITSDAGNKLVGVAVVTEPAVPEAKALLVAEREKEKEDNPVDDQKNTVPEEEQKPEQAEVAETAPEEEAPAEDTPAKEKTAACGTGKEKAEAAPSNEEEDKPADEGNSGEDKPAKEETAACGGGGKEKAETAPEDESSANEEPPANEDEEKAVAEDGEGAKEQLIELSALKEKCAALEERCAALEEELNQRKAAEEDQVKETKRQELRDKVANVLSEDEMASLAEAIDNLDENAVNAALAEKLIQEKILKKENASKKTASFRITDACAPVKNKWITED